MQNAVGISTKSLISVGAALTAIFDVLDPIFSYGSYLVYLLGIILIRYLYLAYKYKTFEELHENRKGGADTHALHDFLQKNWRGNVLLVIFILVAISAVGRHYTKNYKDEGGLIAANSSHVRSLQQALEKLLKGQEEIKESLGGLEKQSSRIEDSTKKISDSVQEISKSAKTPSLTELAKQAKNSPEPYDYLRTSMQNFHFEMTYTPEDILYITSILKERKTALLPTLAYKFLDTCQKDAYPEDVMLEVLRGLNPGGIGGQNLFASRLDAIKLCLQGEASKAMVEFFLTDENGTYSATHYEDPEAMRDLFNACATPISISFFSNANFLPDSVGHDLNVYNLHEIILMNARASVSCISEESATLINERYNRIELLARGYYLENAHTYSAKCNPKVSMEEVENAQRLGVSISKYRMRDAIDNECIDAD